MLNPDVILYMAMGLSFVSVYFVTQALLTNNTDKQILSWANGSEPQKSSSALINWSRPLVHQFTLQHAARVKSPSYRKKLERLIMTAGLSRELNVDEFIGLKIFWGFGLPGFLIVFNFAFGLGIGWPVFVVAIALGWQFPDMYAKSQKKKRELSARADLPFFADLLALSTEAGLDFISAMQRIVDKAEGSVLGDELGIVLKDIKLGASRMDALRGLAKRLDIPEIMSFVAVLVDADATGASISQVLKDQSVQIRLERFVRAEKAGARASQLMLIPLIFFILPAVFIVVFGPVIVNFTRGTF
ncbi:MAG: type II secretion system F family protein [Bdellovibrionaceae bacterium]|nr:type II secretion system F family protein [Pseudobdellovibrionaceae bacterium]